MYIVTQVADTSHIMAVVSHVPLTQEMRLYQSKSADKLDKIMIKLSYNGKCEI